MFSEPQTITVATVAKSLQRIAMGNRDGSFESTVDGIKMRVLHVIGKRTRRTVRIDFTKTAADPLLDGVSRQYSHSVQLVIDQPPVGFSAVELQNNLKALTDWASVSANAVKFVNGES